MEKSGSYNNFLVSEGFLNSRASAQAQFTSTIGNKTPAAYHVFYLIFSKETVMKRTFPSDNGIYSAVLKRVYHGHTFLNWNASWSNVASQKNDRGPGEMW